MVKSLRWVGISGLVFCASVSSVRAEVEVLPESRHHQYLTYGLFTEEQSSLLYRNAGRAWGALGGHIALIELKHWKSRPQVALFGSANSGFRINDKGDTLLTETIDARVGLSFDFELDQDLRIGAGWTHQSGHTSDDVPDRSLIGSNLGNEILHGRVIFDPGTMGRMGATIKCVLGSDPKQKMFAADQFLEWLPFRENPNPKEGTWFVSAGFEEFGVTSIHGIFHAQAGIYFGNHLNPKRTPGIRLAAGYYSGLSPQLKYYQFRERSDTFEYLGMLFNF